jgi:hypothetical protein
MLLPPDQCLPCFEITTDVGRLAEASVVVFHIPTIPNLRRVKKYPGQLWVGMSMESDIYYPRQADKEFMSQFDLRMTYHLDSDVPATYLTHWCLSYETLLREPQPKIATVPAAYFVSNCKDKCGRHQYVRTLMKHMPVHSFGKCLNNRTLARDLGAQTKIETIRSYKFTLAFENAITPDYVTEKFFDALIAGSVPVYRGAPNVEEFAPGDHCFIDASQFSKPVDLAEYLLYLSDNERDYHSFFEWKRKPLRRAFVERFDRFSKHHFHRLCEKLLVCEGAILQSRC